MILFLPLTILPVGVSFLHDAPDKTIKRKRVKKYLIELVKPKDHYKVTVWPEITS